jgi:glycosyltransferase involved in cell wall biosynthesis
VIASSRTSIPEVCGDAAMYCDPTSADDIAAKIEQMMSDAQLRQRHRALGLRHARQFRWDQSARELLEVIYEESGVRSHEMAPRASTG